MSRPFTRRHFLSTGVAALTGSSLAPSFLSRKTPGDSRELSFGLFFDPADLPRMRRSFESAAFTSLREQLAAIDRPALRRFIAEEVRYNDQLFDIVRLSDAAQELSLLYLMTGDEDAAELAATCVRTIMKFDRWDYFLEAGEKVVGIQRASSTLIAVAVAADWLGDQIDEVERRQWLYTMRERGCEPCFLSTWSMRHPDQVVGWSRDETSTYFEHRPEDRVDLSRRHIILDSTNLKAVPASALAIGAVCYEQQFGKSDDSARWIEQATYSLGTFGDFFEADGSYHEGVSYANYTALNILKATSILRRFGVADLTDMINWRGYVDYATGMSLPTDADPYDIVNFGDNGNAKSGEAGRPKRTAVALWVASRLNDAKAQWFGLTLGGEHDEWALIWYDPRMQPEPEPRGPQLWKSDLDWIVARTGYRPVDLVVACRSGGPGNHEHADRNSIIVKCFGEQLVADPYRPPYAWRDPRWMMRTTAGHSAVLVDGRGHEYHDGSEGTNASKARAHLVTWGERRGYAYWTSDATEAYALVDPDIDAVLRTVVVVHRLPMLAVFDKLVKRTEASLLQARFFGFNHDGQGTVREVSTARAADSRGDQAGVVSFELSRPGARLVGVSSCDVGLEARSLHLPIPDDEASKHPFAEVGTTSASRTVGLLTLLVPVPAEAADPDIAIEQSGQSYRTQIATEAGIGYFSLSDVGRIPEFEVRL